MIDKKSIFVTTQRGISLGHQGENEVTEIIFSQPEDLLAQNWALLHQRATDSTPYPVPLAVTAGGLVWTVTSGDTAVNGIGRAQLICSDVDGQILKSVTYSTSVAKSLPLGGEVPDPVRPWYENILDKLNQAGGGTVKSVNGVAPDASGNVEIEVGNGGSAVSLDPTLSQEGKAADAKAVGEAMKEKQPAGDYALKTDIPTVPVQSVNGKTGAVQLGAADVGALPNTTKIPTKVSQLTNDAGYLVHHQDISGKLDADKLPEAVNTALAQAKASGEFDGKDGNPGKDGETPVKGTDYWTEADKQGIVDDVLKALPTWKGGSY